MSRNWLLATMGAVLLAFAGSADVAYAQQATQKSDVCSALERALKEVTSPLLARRALGVSLGDYIECVKACKGEFSGPDLTVCIEGCRFIDSGSEFKILLR